MVKHSSNGPKGRIQMYQLPKKGAVFSIGEASTTQYSTANTCTAMHASLQYNGWLYDTGASVHSTPFRDDFVEYRKKDYDEISMHLLMTANGIIKPVGIGNCIFNTQTLNNETKKIELLDVLHFPNLPMHLLSGQKHLFYGTHVGKHGEIFRKDGFEFFKTDKNMMVWVIEESKQVSMVMPMISLKK